MCAPPPTACCCGAAATVELRCKVQARAGRRGSGPTAPCPSGRSGVLPLRGCRAWGDHAAGAARPPPRASRPARPVALLQRREGADSPTSCGSPTRIASLLVQPFMQHQEEVQPLAMTPHAVAVLARHGANPGGVEPAGIAQARTFRELVGPGAGRPSTALNRGSGAGSKAHGRWAATTEPTRS